MPALTYLIAYCIPFSALLALLLGGVYAYLTIFVAFVLVPLLELLLPSITTNLPQAQLDRRTRQHFYDFLLYLNVPFLWSVLLLYLHTLSTQALPFYELLGYTLSVGAVLGITGINVAHELGHRSHWWDQLLARLLLLPNLYLHFTLEHNYGHHVHIATPADPASARRGESVYHFFLRSVWGSYRSAWRIEERRLRQWGHGSGVALLWQHRILHFGLLQLAYLAAVAYLASWAVLGAAVAVAVIGFLLLETVNYIEHYGLFRRQLPSGRYERVQPWHSWNSDHLLGRVLLYELTRHSDHHYKAARKYPALRHHAVAPQLPLGYPGSMLLALLPPLWFAVMHPKLQKWEAQLATTPVS